MGQCCLNIMNLAYQGRKHFLSSSTGYRETSMRTSVTCSESFAEIIGRLLAGCGQFRGKVDIILLLLKTWLSQISTSNKHMCLR